VCSSDLFSRHPRQTHQEYDIDDSVSAWSGQDFFHHATRDVAELLFRADRLGKCCTSVVINTPATSPTASPATYRVLLLDAVVDS